MDGEWWQADQTVVLHFRTARPGQELARRSLCDRVLRWIAQDVAAKRTERCGYCSYRMARIAARA
jgi:hypothetical protein